MLLLDLSSLLSEQLEVQSSLPLIEAEPVAVNWMFVQLVVYFSYPATTDRHSFSPPSFMLLYGFKYTHRSIRASVDAVHIRFARSGTGCAVTKGTTNILARSRIIQDAAIHKPSRRSLG